MSSEYKRLYRTRDQRMIAGVAAGLGEFFHIDPTLIRLAFVFSAIFYPPTFLGYLILMVVVPEEPLDQPIIESTQPE